MEYRPLGRTGVSVSNLCLGSMMFGDWGNKDHDQSIRIIHRALDAGINFIDIADVYSQGESEVIVGEALAAGRPCQHSQTVLTFAGRKKQMEIKPKPPTVKGPAETFTGDVWVDAIYNGQEPSRARVNKVRFSPGARSAWHSHALGQTLYVTEGAGLIQARGEAIVKIRAGDVVYTPSDEEHWHGAAPDHFMTHLSITEGIGDSDKPETDWGAHVTDAEYRGQP